MTGFYIGEMAYDFCRVTDSRRPLTIEELAPINPNVQDKRIVVKIQDETLLCFEGDTERGCINASSEEAKWGFRWSLPQVKCDPGDVTVEWPGGEVGSATQCSTRGVVLLIQRKRDLLKGK